MQDIYQKYSVDAIIQSLKALKLSPARYAVFTTVVKTAYDYKASPGGIIHYE